MNHLHDYYVTFTQMNLPQKLDREDADYIYMMYVEGDRTYEVCRRMAECGRIDLLDMARRQGYTFDEWTWIYGTGNMSIIEYLHDYRCPHDIWAYYYGIQSGHYDAIRFMIMHHYPYRDRMKWLIDTSKHPSKLTSLIEDAENAKLDQLTV